jgi:N-acetylglutamate synthase-like GNAT family acetyltransferase
MPSVRPFDLESAQRFAAREWPEHNRTQGIVWIQADYALAEHDGEECAGVATYKVVGGVATLEQLIVAHGRTHRGTGSRLLAAFEAHAAQLGCHRIQLETAETQAPRFYEKHGYVRAFTSVDGRFHLDWHLYVKQLREAEIAAPSPHSSGRGKR